MSVWGFSVWTCLTSSASWGILTLKLTTAVAPVCGCYGYNEKYFLLGLRTLCIAMAELEPEDFQRWSDIYYKASTSLENREKNVDEAAELIEKVHKLPILFVK